MEEMMQAKWIRRGLFGVALAVAVACWAWTFGSLALFGHPGVAKWTAMVTVSALATEVTIWVGAFALGWSMFANRRRLWARITGRTGGLV
jgi:hypothetical protein